MKIPLQLRRRPAAEPATALLLTTSDVPHLLALCARIGSDPLPRVYPVADGFLVQLTEPTSRAFPRTVRLRSLVDNLLLPVDADLVPPLWPDEMRVLVRQRGLVFLPGGRVLSFAVDQPLALADLLDVGKVERGRWRSFPSRPVLAERLHEVVLDVPQPSVEDILQTGGEDVAIEEPRPEGSDFLDTLKNKVTFGIGKKLVDLGQFLHLNALSDLGARWIQNAVEQVPRLSEAVLGKQEAALRELLRLFQSGKLDQALRRALPLGGAGDRGGTAAQGNQLPLHRLAYSLQNILGRRGPASIWFGGHDVQRALADEYRKAAEQAMKEGDHRRAAFIYGKLLADYRAAANALFAGGLFRDAAVLYLTQLDDRVAAARSYEAGGEFDTALRLYRQAGAHVQAGDLLRRMGEEDAAVAEYCIAADKLVAQHDWREAGDLLQKAGCIELAEGYYSACWARRPEKNDVACALRLARLYQVQGNGPRLLTVLREARAFFEPAGNDFAACEFFNTVADLAIHPGLSATRDELRDVALQGVAGKLRQYAAHETRPGNTVSQFVGQRGVWPAAVVSDAQFAYRAAVQPASKRVAVRQVSQGPRLGAGPITAVVCAPRSGDLFVAFASGALMAFRPRGDEVVTVKSDRGAAVTSLAVDAEGQRLLTLQVEDGFIRLTGYSRQKGGKFQREHPVELHGEGYQLAPLMVPEQHVYQIGLWADGELNLLDWPTLVPMVRTGKSDREPVTGALLMPAFSPGGSSVAALVGFKTPTCSLFQGRWPGTIVKLSWDLGNLKAGRGQAIPFAWMRHGTELDLAGVDDQGVLYWSRLAWSGERLAEVLTARSCPYPLGYQCAAVVRPGLIAGVRTTGIDWLVAGSTGFRQPQPQVKVWSPIIGAFPSPLTNELLLLRSDGVVERTPVPDVG